MRFCSAQEAKERLERGGCALVDVREYPEFTEAHIEGGRLIPLPELRRRPELAGKSGEVLLLCGSGKRAREAAEVLTRHGAVEPLVIEGGIAAWREAGHPVRRLRGPISLERQVRIAAGALVLIGLVLDLLLPGTRLLSAFVAAGLVFSGVTNTCGMGLLLARFPWNRPRTDSLHSAVACDGR